MITAGVLSALGSVPRLPPNDTSTVPAAAAAALLGTMDHPAVGVSGWMGYHQFSGAPQSAYGLVPQILPMAVVPFAPDVAATSSEKTVHNAKSPLELALFRRLLASQTHVLIDTPQSSNLNTNKPSRRTIYNFPKRPDDLFPTDTRARILRATKHSCRQFLPPLYTRGVADANKTPPRRTLVPCPPPKKASSDASARKRLDGKILRPMLPMLFDGNSYYQLRKQHPLRLPPARDVSPLLITDNPEFHQFYCQNIVSGPSAGGAGGGNSLSSTGHWQLLSGAPSTAQNPLSSTQESKGVGSEPPQVPPAAIFPSQTSGSGSSYYPFPTRPDQGADHANADDERLILESSRLAGPQPTLRARCPMHHTELALGLEYLPAIPSDEQLCCMNPECGQAIVAHQWHGVCVQCAATGQVVVLCRTCCERSDDSVWGSVG